jgi:DNA helicase II / ATP-dependent DNA helicase PcrA
VGMTRAKQKLIMTNAAVRRIYGQTQVSPASRFLHEIPAELVDAEIVRAEGSGSYGVRSQWEAQRPRGNSAYSGGRDPYAKKVTSGGRTYEYDSSDDAGPSYEVQVASSENGQQIKVGQRVKHETYGAGIVKLLEGSENDRKITIEFGGGVGKKKFSLNHVHLEKL